jgi:hypothetical protein
LLITAWWRNELVRWDQYWYHLMGLKWHVVMDIGKKYAAFIIFVECKIT